MKKMWIALFVFAALVVLLVGGLIVTADDFSRPIDFKKHILRNRPNQFLACPPDYCLDKPHMTTPVFPISVEELKQKLTHALKSEHRLEKLDQISTEDTWHFEQTSKTFGFPDRITIKFIALSPDTSSLAIYSRAKYGRRDFAVNKKRVQRWLKKLANQM